MERGEAGIGEHCENGNPPVRDAELPVTQPNDPPDLVISGGHFSVGTLKTPLQTNPAYAVESVSIEKRRGFRAKLTHPGPAREGSVIIMEVRLCAFNSAHSENTGSSVEPHHSNASTISVATGSVPDHRQCWVV